MSHLLDDLRERRSVRKYQTRPVPEELVRKVLEAAGWAPSAHNAQPWRFIVLADPQVKRRLAEAMAKAGLLTRQKKESPLSLKHLSFGSKDSPMHLHWCSRASHGWHGEVSRQRKQELERDLAMQSLAAAMQNLLLAAHRLGLGDMLVLRAHFCKKPFGKPWRFQEVEPEALIVLGYPAEEPPAPSRKRVGDYCFREGGAADLVRILSL